MATLKDVVGWTEMEGDCDDANTVSGSLLALVGGKSATLLSKLDRLSSS